MMKFEKLGNHVFVTKLAGFEHTEYIQQNETKAKINKNDIPLIQGKNIRNGNFIEKYEWYISKEISDKLVRSKLDKQCLLIPYVGSNLGEVGIFEHPYDCHMASNIAKIELIDDYFDIYYLKYYLQSKLGNSYLFKAKQGSAQPNITMESIRNTLVIDLPKEIQKNIGNYLNNIDRAINILEKQNEISENYCNTLFNYWFNQFEFPDINGVSYVQNKGKMKFDSLLGRNIPEKWNSGNIYEICNLINGLACQKFRPKNEEKKLPVIKIREMHSGYDEETEFCSSYIDKKHIVRMDDILFSWSATLEVMKWNQNEGALNQHIFKVVQRDYPKNYVYLQLKNYVCNFVKMAEARKTTMGHITSDHIKKSKIVLPDKNILVKFETETKPYFDLISNNNKKILNLKKIKELTLDKLISGEVKIN